jgi:hypothetical protein
MGIAESARFMVCPEHIGWRFAHARREWAAIIVTRTGPLSMLAGRGIQGERAKFLQRFQQSNGKKNSEPM